MSEFTVSPMVCDHSEQHKDFICIMWIFYAGRRTCQRVAAHANLVFFEVCDFLNRAWVLDMSPKDFSITCMDDENTMCILDQLTIDSVLSANRGEIMHFQVELPVHCLDTATVFDSRFRPPTEELAGRETLAFFHPYAHAGGGGEREVEAWRIEEAKQRGSGQGSTNDQAVEMMKQMQEQHSQKMKSMGESMGSLGGMGVVVSPRKNPKENVGVAPAAWERELRRSRIRQPHGVDNPIDCTEESGFRQVLWCAIRAAQQEHPGVACVVYTGDKDVSPSDLLRNAKNCFGVELDPAGVHFAFLKGRCKGLNISYLINRKNGPLIKMGYAFTLPLFALLGGCRIGCYVHYPTISTDRYAGPGQGSDSGRNNSVVARSAILSFAKLLYYRAFAALYGFAGRFAEVVLVNSSWTRGHVDAIWRVPERTSISYPPCDTRALAALPLQRSAKEWGGHLVLSLAQFRPEKNHALQPELQLRAFHSFLQQAPKCCREAGSEQRVRLVLAGGCRDLGDRKRVEALRELCKELGLKEGGPAPPWPEGCHPSPSDQDDQGTASPGTDWDVQFRTNVPLQEMQALLGQADVGIHTMRDEHFGISVVEFMAAGAVVIAHNSAGPALDIVTPLPDGRRTGLLADDEAGYAARLSEALLELGDIAGLRKLVNEGKLKIDKADYDKRTALHLACSEGKLPVVRRLVEELGSEINVVDQWGGTPLDDAIRCGFKPVCEFLVSKGGIIGKTAFAADDAGILCEAGAKGNLNCLRGLARRKVDMNLADYDKRTAIHLASSEGKLKAVKCLIEELKADPNVYDRFGGTPLDDAQRHGHKETVAYLKSQGAVSGKGGTVSTQDAADLCDAASSGDLDKLRAIVKKGIDANSGDYDLRTAIHLAAAEGLVQVLKCLFDELEGNPNVVDRWGGTPLDDAKRAGKKEVIEYLESKGAVPGKFTMFSDNALITTNAAGKNDLATLRGITTN
ncbi:unnamed protein product, partial [Polarella glacialis]